MNAYYMTDSAGCKEWIRGWIGRFPREREGIWNVRHAERLLTYVDEEYGRKGLRSGWRIIKVRMVDLDEEATPQGNEEEEKGDRLAVEIYSRNRMGWSVDYVDIP
ncbi:C6 zinc finger domain protein [Colletotrichum tofieldiae]|nr:C6 zinc finger domain protein [Colletotrichum tofieldiae]